MLIDSHCHLDFPDFADELDAVVGRAQAAGVARMVTISTRVKRHAGLIAIAERFPDVYCSVGTHPQHAHEELDVGADELIARTRHPKVVAIGEAGLDYHYESSPRDAQEQGLRNHIAAARATGLPLVIHSRDADADMAQILEQETGKGAFPAVLHCFTGGRELAERAIALGLYISFTGILTFSAPSPRTCRPTGSWSRPTRPISRPAAIAANATSRLSSPRPPTSWPRPAASRQPRSRARPRTISFGCSARCRGMPTILINLEPA
jgi:TatD family hydrolase